MARREDFGHLLFLPHEPSKAEKMHGRISIADLLNSWTFLFVVALIIVAFAMYWKFR